MPESKKTAPKSSDRHGASQAKLDFVNNNQDKCMEVLVYDRIKEDGNSSSSSTVDNDKTKCQGVWKDHSSYEVSPSLIWAYPLVPSNLNEMTEIRGLWAFAPGLDEKAINNPASLSPQDIWFFGPNTRPPSNVTPRGIWLFPLIHKDISKLAENESGFLDVGENRAKQGQLEVGGTWKILYKKGAQEKEEVKGPGMKPRTPKQSSKPKVTDTDMKGPGMSPRPKKPKKMRINVQTPDGDTFVLQVEPKEPISTVQRRVEEKTEIPVEDQTLRFDGEKLSPSQMLSDYNIKDGDTIVLEGMKIHIQHWNGKQFTLNVKSHNTINEIKDMIHKAKKIPKKDQRLTFHDKPLTKGTNTLEKYGIKNNSTLVLNPMVILVENEKGKRIPFQVEPSNTVQDIKKLVQKKLQIPIADQKLTFEGRPLENEKTLQDSGIDHGNVLNLRSSMNIRVKLWDGSVFKIKNCNPSDILDHIQDRIQQQIDVPKHFQRILFKNQLLTDPRKSLEDYSIKNNDVLELLPIEINVKLPDGKILPLNVTPEDTINDIKKRVEKKSGIPANEQRYKYNGEQIENDNDTVEDLGMKHGDTIAIDSMQIHVKHWDGSMTTYDVQPNDTLNEVMSQIEHRLHIPQDHQRLAFDGRPLKDPRKTLNQYAVVHDDVLELLPMHINVRTPENKIITLLVAPDDDIQKIKSKVEKKSGILTKDQRYLFDGSPLDDDRETLDDLGIKHGDTIEMDSMRIHIRGWDGVRNTFDVQPSDTIDNIMTRIEEDLSIPRHHQRLVFEEKPLKDPRKTLQQCSIQNDDTLELIPMQITVKTPTGVSVPVLVTPYDTVKSVKKRVEKKAGIPVKEQRYTFNGDPVANDADTLDRLGIKHGDVILMESMKIHVRHWDGSITSYEVKPDDVLDDIMIAIEGKIGLLKQDQRLVLDGTALEDPSKTLQTYSIAHDDTLDLLAMEIYVLTPEMEPLTISVTPEDTLAEIKEKVCKQSGISKHHQRLTFKDELLEDDDATLRDLTVRHHDTLILKPMEIFVRDTEENVFTLRVSPDQNISSIKNAIQVALAIPKEHQRLFFNDDLLEDTPTLRQIGVEHQDILVLNPMHIHVKLWDGRKFTFNVRPSNTALEIKQMVQSETDLPPNKQRLQFKNKTMKEHVSLEEAGVKHDNSLFIPKSLSLTSPTKSRKSYLPDDWKEQQDRYGEVITRVYEINHDVDEGESFIRGIMSEDREKFKVNTARKSVKDQSEDAD